jgi:hypothetical protein
MGLLATVLVAVIAVLAVLYIGIGHESQFVFSPVVMKVRQAESVSFGEMKDIPVVTANT